MIWTKLAKKEWLQWVIQSKLLNGTVDSFVEIAGFVISNEISKLVASKE